MAIFNSELLIFYYLRGYILHPMTPITPMAAVPLPTRLIDLVLEWNLYIYIGRIVQITVEPIRMDSQSVYQYQEWKNT